MGSQSSHPERGAKPAANADSVTHAAVPVAVNGGPPSVQEGSSRSTSVRRPAAPVREEKTVISKRPPPAELPVLKPALNPFELGRTLEGERLGHFQLEKFVGGGGMGAVFRANDTMLGRTVAVKVLSRDQTDEDTLRRFQNEAQSAARLDHPNIARVYYVGEDRGLHYIVFEFIEGVNIRDLVIEQGPLPLTTAIHFTLQVAEALDHAAMRDVVHRDIKPSNVLVMPDDHVKLVDMGLARLHQVEATAADLTASGVTLGTFDYISPEQARDPRSADVRSDLYSLGCTLFFMLTARPPFPEGTVLQKLLSHSSEPPPNLLTFRPELDPQVAEIVNKLLAKQPAQRYQTPSELIAALILIAERLGLGDIGQRGRFLVTPTEPKYLWVERHLPWAVPLSILIATVLGFRWLTPTSAPLTLEQIRPQYLTALANPHSSGEPQTSETSDAKTGTDSKSATSPSADSATKSPNGESKKSDAGGEAATSGSSANATQGGSATADKDPRNSERPGSTTDKPDAARIPTTATTPTDVSTKTDRATDPKKADSEDSPPANVASESNSPAPTVADRVTPNTPSPTVANPSPAPNATLADSAPAANLVIVHDGTAIVPVGVRQARSLTDALRMAGETKEIATIELWSNLEVVNQSLDVPSRPLEIRPGKQTRPVVVFRPKQIELAVDRQMVRMNGGEITWRGIQIVWELPSEPYESWSLFQLTNGASLEFADCVLTLRNAAERGGVLQRQVAFTHLVAPPVTETPKPNGDENNLMMVRTVPSSILLTNSIVRGQATLVRSLDGVPFRFTAQNCLIATTDRMAEIGGASQQPTLGDAVQITLRHVTAFVGEGLALSKLDANGSYPLELVVDCQHSILLTGPKSALLQQRGTASQPYRKRPSLRGSMNFYPYTSVILTVDTTGNPDDLEEYTFSDRDAAREERWYDDRPEPGLVTWKTPPRNLRRVDQHTKLDYLLEDEPSNKAFGVAGFDPAMLPDVLETALAGSNGSTGSATPD